MSIFSWKHLDCLLDKISEYLGKLFETAIVDCLEEGTFFDPFERGNTLLGEVILFERLKKFTPGREFFQVVVDQCFEFIIDSHLQRAVPPGFEFFICLESLKDWGKKQFE